ncbi:MAG: hypothetical protein KatS3mg082_1177 [Nitrospiraceae bacterium]|nr:MAG: hypothetical protein KatS3mg082_1177 [Nitrospiraceae bacterium]
MLQLFESLDCFLLTFLKGVLIGYFGNLTYLPLASLRLWLEMNEIVPNSIHCADMIHPFG